MNKLEKKISEDLSSRKKDHIKMAFEAQVSSLQQDSRFLYEPMLSKHHSSLEPFSFLGKQIQTPIWISSMTGGTKLASQINFNLAKVANAFGMSMGLGSCRPILYSDDQLADFDVRKTLGYENLLFANLGIAQIEELFESNEIHKLIELVAKLQADGLIIHVNPLQEWLQPEGDRFKYAPIDTIKRVLDEVKFPIIIKEVGQGIGYHSLKELIKLPLAAIDFAAHGGTNFSKLELIRSSEKEKDYFQSIQTIGHSALEMIDFTNNILNELEDKAVCKSFIISGGIKNFVDGYYLMNKLNSPSVYGQASTLLKYALESYDSLHNYIDAQVRGLVLANSYFKIRQ